MLAVCLSFQVLFKARRSAIPDIQASCSCPIWISGACGHITGLLYQLAKYKILGAKALPEDIAKTSQPQTWHVPRGLKLVELEVQDIEVRGYSRNNPMPEGIPRAVKSTLYNPIRSEGVNWRHNFELFSSADQRMLILPAIGLSDVPLVNSKFGLVVSKCM